jgi:hypothetical protein
MISDPIAVAIWPYRLSRATRWARGSIANTDAPLAYELAAALALRGHMEVSGLREKEEPQESTLFNRQLRMAARVLQESRKRDKSCSLKFK